MRLDGVKSGNSRPPHGSSYRPSSCKTQAGISLSESYASDKGLFLNQLMLLRKRQIKIAFSKFYLFKQNAMLRITFCILQSIALAIRSVHSKSAFAFLNEMK
ncbi:hypothetical protein [Bacillus wiedmannii]|uniref:hypothetical protein n=1 Tax=Bacillus wiedmannii TaxID=1890302 RepID=UPI000BF5C187|nr:hypothetical protein [Bacillus wiedmannii]PEU24474.1 hypothetical protein CN532_21900 [Bacillus wiedmannii]